MKTYANLFESICYFANLHRAWRDARRCKRYRAEILRFGYDAEGRLLEIRDDLLKKTYRHGPYRHFVVHDAKKRHIQAAPFRDRVVHHALSNVIEPLFESGFIFDSYACRKAKGTHKAVRRLETFLRSLSDAARSSNGGAPELYCLSCDIAKYFESIDHDVLFSLTQQKIADRDTLWLVGEIIQSSHTEPGKGIPIGNLTSQLFANVYLNVLDQYVKHTLRERYYIRYMDDFLVLGTSAKHLHAVRRNIEAFLHNALLLRLHPQKARVFPARTGIDFLGYRVYGTHRLLRKSTVKRFVKRTRRLEKEVARGSMKKEALHRSVQSWAAYAKHANSWRLRSQLEETLKVPLTRRHLINPDGAE